MGSSGMFALFLSSVAEIIRTALGKRWRNQKRTLTVCLKIGESPPRLQSRGAHEARALEISIVLHRKHFSQYLWSRFVMENVSHRFLPGQRAKRPWCTTLQHTTSDRIFFFVASRTSISNVNFGTEVAGSSKHQGCFIGRLSGIFDATTRKKCSIFVAVEFFFERFEFLVCSRFNHTQCGRTCACAVACLCPHNSISNVVASLTIHDNTSRCIYIYIYICLQICFRDVAKIMKPLWNVV